MPERRLLLLGLDGYDAAYGDRLMAEGLLPNLSALAACAARVPLDHGRAKHTGLAWEHVSTGRSPDAASRWAAVTFDPETYDVWQAPTGLPPFTAGLDARCVVFDPPYFDLSQAPGTQGVVAWGAHDPGVPRTARPDGLGEEMDARFGQYPAKEHIYGFSWPSPELTREAGEQLARAVDLRAEISEWLLGERLPDWDIGMVVPSELHSGTEALWHGEDESHVLHGLPSAPAAREALRATYAAIDRLVGRLVGAFPTATVAAFNLHGMGANLSDVPDMVLLSDLLLRRDTGKSLVAVRPEWRQGLPMLDPGERWESAVFPPPARPAPRRGAGAAAWRVARRFGLGRRRGGGKRHDTPDLRAGRRSLEWMPATRYRAHWPAMRAFALPSFYDGQIRVNLAGRERHGRVAVEEYRAECEALIALMHECRDYHTGEPVVDEVWWEPHRDPLTLHPTQADLIVTWKTAFLGFSHPALGEIGPVPARRPGGHEGGPGVAFFAGPGIEPGTRPMQGAFDVVPTAVDLVGETLGPGHSGESFAPLLFAGSPEPATV